MQAYSWLGRHPVAGAFLAGGVLVVAAAASGFWLAAQHPAAKVSSWDGAAVEYAFTGCGLAAQWPDGERIGKYLGVDRAGRALVIWFGVAVGSEDRPGIAMPSELEPRRATAQAALGSGWAYGSDRHPEAVTVHGMRDVQLDANTTAGLWALLDAQLSKASPAWTSGCCDNGYYLARAPGFKGLEAGCGLPGTSEPWGAIGQALDALAERIAPFGSR